MNEETSNKISRFLKRCINLPGYIVTAYLKDKKSCEAVRNFIDELQSYLILAEWVNAETSLKFLFNNGSVFEFIANRPKGKESHVIIVDQRMSRKELDAEIAPKIIQYETETEAGAMFNPKPIYLKFVESE